MKKVLVAGVLAATMLASGPAWAQENVGVRGTWSAPANSAGAFHNMEELFPTRRIAPGDKVMPLQSPTAPFAQSYSFKGKTYDLDAFATNTRTSGLIIMRGNKILYERYYQGSAPDSRFVSFSVGKSFVASLIGIALAEGKKSGPTPEEEAAATAQKAELIAKLEEAGIQHDKRWGIEKLTAALAEGKKD